MAEQSGFILVSAVTATGSYPLEGAEVMISELTDKGDTVIYRYITDESFIRCRALTCLSSRGSYQDSR